MPPNGSLSSVQGASDESRIAEVQCLRQTEAREKNKAEVQCLRQTEAREKNKAQPSELQAEQEG